MATCSKYILGDKKEASDSECDSISNSVSSNISSESSENSERCAICLSRFKEQDTGQPSSCEHIYCLECIDEWSKVSTLTNKILIIKNYKNSKNKNFRTQTHVQSTAKNSPKSSHVTQTLPKSTIE